MSGLRSGHRITETVVHFGSVVADAESVAADDTWARQEKMALTKQPKQHVQGSGGDCFTCGAGRAAGSVSRNLPAIHVCQADVWIWAHVKVVAAKTQTDISDSDSEDRKRKKKA